MATLVPAGCGITESCKLLLTLTEEGQKKLMKLTSESIGKRIAILIDDKLISVEVVSEPISGKQPMLFPYFGSRAELERIARSFGN